MKETYIDPEFELVVFASEDVIATSGLKAMDDGSQTVFPKYDSKYFE